MISCEIRQGVLRRSLKKTPEKATSTNYKTKLNFVHCHIYSFKTFPFLMYNTCTISHIEFQRNITCQARPQL